MSLANTLTSPATFRIYRSENGAHHFRFAFIPEGDHLAIYCLTHPPLNGHDPDANKTHLFSSGKICLVAGREPRDHARAEELAKQWAEYFLEYRRTGIAQH